MEYLRTPLLSLIAAAIIIPLLVHFFLRKKPEEVEYSTLFLIRKIYRKIKRSILIKEIIVVTLRVLIFLFLLFLFFHPYKTVQTAHTGSVTDSVAIIVDDTVSMKAGKGETFWERGVKEAIGILRKLPADSSSLLYLCGSNIFKIDNPVKLIQFLSSRKPVWKTEVLNNCISRTVEIVSSRFGVKIPVVIVSDFQRNRFSPEALPDYQELIFKKVSEPIRNAGIVSGSVNTVFLHGVRVMRGDFTFRGCGISGEKEVVEVRKGKRTLTRSVVKFSNSGLIKKSIYWSDTSQVFEGYLKLPDDNFEEDNRYFVTLFQGRNLRVLIVEGDPEPIPTEGGTYYLYTALKLMENFSPGSIVHNITYSEFKRVSPDDYDVIFLSNIPDLSAREVSSLSEWVSRGGRLVVILGDQINIDRYNSRFSLLNGGNLRGNVRTKKGVIPETESIALNLDDTLKEKLALVHFYGYTLFNRLPENSTVLIKLNNGAPLIVESEMGRGKVLYYLSTVDDEWTDFPFKTAFLPLWYLLLNRLFAGKISINGAQFSSGSNVIFTSASPFSIEVRKPDGTIKKVVAEKGAGGYKALFAETDQPGIYHVFQSGKPLPELNFAVNIPPEESFTCYYKSEELRGKGGTGKIFVKSRKDLSPYILLILILLIFSEGAVNKWM